MKYYIEIATNNKAKRDINEICCREGFTNLTRYNFGKGGVGRFMTKFVSVTSILWKLKKGDMLFLQYPMKKFYYLTCLLAKMKGSAIVTVIHDLGAFRRHKLTPEGENRRLSKTDFLIVHNPAMYHYIQNHGFKNGIHCLQIFDYLSNSQAANYSLPHKPWRVVYAGGLGRWRNAFLYKLEPIMKGWQMELYGKGFDNDDNYCDQLHYHGFMNSDDFIANVDADFGLVWDGDSTEECTGNWGVYLRINNPHKTSFYLRAGIPVIVWKESAMAQFVEAENVGIVVDGLSQIGNRLSALTAEQYADMRKAAIAISSRLNNGYYIKEGLNAADKYLQSHIS